MDFIAAVFVIFIWSLIVVAFILNGTPPREVCAEGQLIK